MCMEDIRLGRKSYARVNLVAVPAGTGNTEILPADPHRTNFIITSVDGSVFWVSDKPMTATATGLRVAPNNTNIADFSVQDHGDFVTDAIYAWSDAGATIAILETALEQK